MQSGDPKFCGKWAREGRWVMVGEGKTANVLKRIDQAKRSPSLDKVEGTCNRHAAAGSLNADPAK